MAKIAKVGYGSDGRGLGRTEGEEPQGYTYIVNDNVRTGDIIQVVATSRAGRKFGTTGKTLHAFKETSVKGQNAKRDLDENSQNLQEPTKVYSGKELGVGGFRGRTQKEQLVASQYEDGEKPQSKYTENVRGGNIAKYMQEHPNEDVKLTNRAQKSLESYNYNTRRSEKTGQTFDEYSKKYMK